MTLTEALVVGQNWQDDVRVILFVRMADGVNLDYDLRRAIAWLFALVQRHAMFLLQSSLFPIFRTRSGKITELAVRDIIHGRAIKNTEALANAEALAFFKILPELRRPGQISL